ncbi:MAG: transcription termination factor NusA [candidate division WOR-3 bacterium]
MANEDNLIIESIKTIARTRGVKYDYVIDSLVEAIKSGVRKKFGKGTESDVSVNKSTGEIKIALIKKVVEEVKDPDKEISLQEALTKKECKVGDEIRIPVAISELGRTAIESVKQALTQRISEAERNRIMGEYEKKLGEIVKGIIKVVSRNEVLVDLGPVEATITKNGLISTEHYRLDSPIRAVVAAVERSQWGPRIILSRTDPKFLERLLYYEIPEIKEGLIQIVKTVRNPGVRAKVAVQTIDPKIDPVGACVGYRGSRIQSIVKELSGEKIDVIQWSKDLNLLVSRALSPAKVKDVVVVSEGNIIAVVPDEDYSKAIGKNGVNVELASRLTGVHIEIKKASEYEKEIQEKILAETKIENVEGLSKELKKLLIEKGYTNVLSVLKATPDELKLLLSLDDAGVDELLAKLKPKEEKEEPVENAPEGS